MKAFEEYEEDKSKLIWKIFKKKEDISINVRWEMSEFVNIFAF